MSPLAATVSGVVLIVAGLGLLWTVFRNSGSRWPQDGFQWISSVLSLGAVLCGMFVLLTGARAPVQIASSGIASPDEILEMDLDQEAQNFGFNLVENGWESNLDVYKGKVILINVWATWCGPCLQEIPDLNRLQDNYGDKGLVVISLSDETQSELQAFQEMLPMSTESGFVDGSKRVPKPIQEAFVIRPTSYIVDRDGRYRKYILGARDYAYFEKAIRPYL